MFIQQSCGVWTPFWNNYTTQQFYVDFTITKIRIIFARWFRIRAPKKKSGTSKFRDFGQFAKTRGFAVFSKLKRRKQDRVFFLSNRSRSIPRWFCKRKNSKKLKIGFLTGFRHFNILIFLTFFVAIFWHKNIFKSENIAHIVAIRPIYSRAEFGEWLVNKWVLLSTKWCRIDMISSMWFVYAPREMTGDEEMIGVFTWDATDHP